MWTLRFSWGGGGNRLVSSGGMPFHRLLRRKSLDAIMAEAGAHRERQLRRVLGPFELIALGVGAVIGAGIFASIGTAAAGGAHHMGLGRRWWCRW